MRVKPETSPRALNLYRFGVCPPGAGAYTFVGSSGDQTIDLGTYWADPSDHNAQLGGGAFDFANGFQFFNYHNPVYVSSYDEASASPSLNGLFQAQYLVSTLDHTGAIIDTNLGIGSPFPNFSMIRDFQGQELDTSLTFQDFAGCLGFRLQGDSTIGIGPSKVANAIQFSLIFSAGTYITGQSVTVVVPDKMYYIGGALPALQ